MTTDTTHDPEFDTLDRELDTLFAPVRPGASMESRLVYALRNVPARPKLNRTRKAFVWATAATVGLGTIGGALSMIDNFEGLPLPGTASLSSSATSSRIHREVQDHQTAAPKPDDEFEVLPNKQLNNDRWERTPANDGRFVNGATPQAANTRGWQKPQGGIGGIGGGIGGGGIGGIGGGFQGGGPGTTTFSVDAPANSVTPALEFRGRANEAVDRVVKETKARGEWTDALAGGPANSITPALSAAQGRANEPQDRVAKQSGARGDVRDGYPVPNAEDYPPVMRADKEKMLGGIVAGGSGSPDGGGKPLAALAPADYDGKSTYGLGFSAGKEVAAETERYYRRAEETREKLGKDAVTELHAKDLVDAGKRGNLATREAGQGEGKGDGKKNENTLTYEFFVPTDGLAKPNAQPAGTTWAAKPGETTFADVAAVPDASAANLTNRAFAAQSGQNAFGATYFNPMTLGAPQQATTGAAGFGKSVNNATPADLEKQIKLLEQAAKSPSVSQAELAELNRLKAQMVQASKDAAPAPAGPTNPTPAKPTQAGPVTAQPPAAPPVAKKIVIRSGELEFEVESFDNATAVITGLTAPIPGGFVSTVNSEKLPNGKVRGTVVVRIPPEKLDQFVLDLRRDLGKTGELKGQKIGSQDITKQFTDMESRLRAARAMEERLISMIKEGKGTIKDLLEAEKELGVWRTKIEETEGELKYYANLAALSTLTIIVVEKEIRASLGVTESERVSTGVEVEDVEAAFRAVQTAVADAKGRVTKSELKQHAAGQFAATLHFEVAPEAGGPIRDRLKQLGRVARLEIDRVQHADGGQTIAKDAKVKRGDTQFFLELYNLANIEPRETVTLSLAAQDVPAAYQALRDAIARVNGRVFDAQMNERDKQNVTATLNFDVKRTDEGAARIALDAAGETVARNVVRVPEATKYTDTKIRFNVTVQSAGLIKPRDTVTTTVSAADVPAAYAGLREAVTKANGRVLVAQVNEQDRQNVTAALHFEVKKVDEGAVRAALLAAGESIARSVIRAPENEAVTDSKVGFKVTMQSANLIRPRETVSLGLIVPEVPAAYQALREAVAKANGQVLAAQLNEHDKQNVTASLNFKVNREEVPAIRAALVAAGDAIGGTVARAAEGSETTDAKVGFQVTVTGASQVRPREATTLGIEVQNVESTVNTIAAIVAEVKGRPIDAQTRHDPDGKVAARLIYDVPLAAAPSVVERIKASGKVRVSMSTQDKNAPEGRFATARLDVQLANAEAIVGPEDGIWPKIKKGLSYSANVLLTSLTWIVFGLCVALPWAVLGFGGYKLVKRITKPTTPEPAPVPPPPAGQ